MPCKHTGDRIHILGEHVVCNSMKVRIPFASVDSLEFSAELECGFLTRIFLSTRIGTDCFLDVHISDGGMPRMRFMPTFVLIAGADDDETQRLLPRLFLQLEGAEKYTDAFLDMACLRGDQAELGDAIFLHRCLQHTEIDIRSSFANRARKTIGSCDCGDLNWDRRPLNGLDIRGPLISALWILDLAQCCGASPHTVR